MADEPKTGGAVDRRHPRGPVGWLLRRGHRALGFVTRIAFLVTALWAVGLWFRVLADEYGHAYPGVLGVAVRTLWIDGGALALVAARLGTWALALTAPLWISAAVLEHRRRWDTSALHD